MAELFQFPGSLWPYGIEGGTCAAAARSPSSQRDLGLFAGDNGDNTLVVDPKNFSGWMGDIWMILVSVMHKDHKAHIYIYIYTLYNYI